ncbi:TetR/AcrR family transcriptional regulator [Flexithrix dorotheae]|uniref:TetR/AcrR family transcriptional regulator n=1 Tax=Flexithrix dorotheae TaxID=70993 RepID=UPI000378C4AC|nr:TetR/AcrR family transcriptional regulator [Flexithrix dorotheae]
MKRSGVKERIIETASRLFYNEGYNQTGINQIIEEANVAKASMYQHFRSKEDIAVAYLERRHQIWMNNLFDFVSGQTDYKNKVLSSFEYLNSWLTEVGFRGCGFQNIITDLPKDHTKIKAQTLYHKNVLRKWIQDLVKEDKQYSENEAEELGDEIMVLLEGAIMLSQIQKAAWPILKAKNVCQKLLNK